MTNQITKVADSAEYFIGATDDTPRQGPFECVWDDVIGNWVAPPEYHAAMAAKQARMKPIMANSRRVVGPPMSAHQNRAATPTKRPAPQTDSLFSRLLASVKKISSQNDGKR
jgi:hypothetical protein